MSLHIPEYVSKKIIDIAKRLNTKNMLSSADGNISFRLDETHIAITPTGKNKAFIDEKDLAVITLDGTVVSGSPSGERLMHLEVFRNSPKAKAIVHAHPPTSIAWSIAYPELKELPNECMSELILALGRVPIVPYARPGTQIMGDVLKPFLPECRVMILSRHGALAWGEDLDEAYNGIERLEHTATILMHAKTLGQITTLPEEEIKILKEMRKKMGDRTL